MKGVVDPGTDHAQEVELDEHGNIINPEIKILTPEEAAEIEASLEPDEITVNLNRFWRRYGRQLQGFKPSKHRIHPNRARVTSEAGTLATQPPPWLERRKRRVRNKAAKQARKANR
jgi:hypothetical protein